MCTRSLALVVGVWLSAACSDEPTHDHQHDSADAAIADIDAALPDAGHQHGLRACLEAPTDELGAYPTTLPCTLIPPDLALESP